MNSDYSKRHNNTMRITTTITIIIIVVISLIIYYSLSIFIIPQLYFLSSSEVKPNNVGRFVIFVKTIALPHTNELGHYPKNGIKDHQGEFVVVSSIEVVNK